MHLWNGATAQNTAIFILAALRTLDLNLPISYYTGYTCKTRGKWCRAIQQSQVRFYIQIGYWFVFGPTVKHSAAIYTCAPFLTLMTWIKLQVTHYFTITASGNTVSTYKKSMGINPFDTQYIALLINLVAVYIVKIIKSLMSYMFRRKEPETCPGSF
jgi:hypothetical protein